MLSDRFHKFLNQNPSTLTKKWKEKTSTPQPWRYLHCQSDPSVQHRGHHIRWNQDQHLYSQIQLIAQQFQFTDAYMVLKKKWHKVYGIAHHRVLWFSAKCSEKIAYMTKNQCLNTTIKYSLFCHWQSEDNWCTRCLSM